MEATMLWRLVRLAALVFVLVVPSQATAAVITVSLPDFNGPFNDSGFPIDLGVIGTFTYAVSAGDVIAAATFSGTYGTQQVPDSTAGFDVSLAGQTLNGCVMPDPGCFQAGADFRPFSFALNPSTFAALATGSVALDVLQTSVFHVRLGTPTLTINTRRAVPEPTVLALLGSGFALLASRRRR
jgi:hypothetical protein